MDNTDKMVNDESLPKEVREAIKKRLKTIKKPVKK